MEKAIFYIFLTGNLDKELVFNAIHRLSHTLLPLHFSRLPPSAALLHGQESASGAKPGFFTFRLLRVAILMYYFNTSRVAISDFKVAIISFNPL